MSSSDAAPGSPDLEGVESAGASGQRDVWSLLQREPRDHPGQGFDAESGEHLGSDRQNEPSQASPGLECASQTEDEREWYSQVQDLDRESFECVNGESHDPPPSIVQPASLPSKSRLVWLEGGKAETDAVQMVSAAVNKKRRLDLARLPWDPKPTHLQQSYRSFLGGLPELGIRDTLLNSFEKEVELQPLEKIPWTVSRRLAKLRVPKTDADIRDSALKRLKTLVLLDPEATALGSSLVEQGKALASDEVIMQSLADAFRGKASLTLQKRSLSLQTFVVGSYDASIDSPWRLSESQIYKLFSDIRDRGSKASTASHILEALRFFHATARFKYMDLEEALSSRVRGVAQDLKLTKAPLRQRDSLTRSRVEALEGLMQSGSDWTKCVVGQFLFCIHSSCRWSDSQNVLSLHLTAEGEGQLLIAEALGSKTSTTVEAKTRLLPYVCVAYGVSNTPWAALWLEAREREGLSFDRGCLPTWSQKWGCWGQERMSSEEAGDILLEVLTALGMPPGPDESIGTHSFKATLITWSGWSSTVGFSPKERLLMGHHMRKGGSSSTLIYSRQYYINLAGKILAMFRTIRQGFFDPDSGVSERVAAIASTYAGETGEASERPRGPRPDEEQRAEEADACSTESAESGVDYAPMPAAGNRVRPPFECTVQELRVHTLSGIVHRLRDESTFFCGRPLTERYRDFDEDDAEDPDTCHQCRRVMSGAD